MIMSAVNSKIFNALNYHIESGNILSWLKMALVAFFIFLFFIILRHIFTHYIFPQVLKIADKTDTYLDEKVLDAFERPLRILFIVLGIFFALRYLPLPESYDIILVKLLRTSLIIIVAWGLYNLTGSHSSFTEEVKTIWKIDYTIIQFFSKVFRVLIVIIALLVLAEEWDYDVDGFIAGLGLGGLAFALAAKDALANIFGGMVIIIDKPFAVGDWIKTPSLEGTVEEISFRSTRIRAFDQALITMPNSKLAEEPITNFTRMGKRRIKFYLGVTYDTPPDKMRIVIEKIKTMLINHPEVHPETIIVSFEHFSESSLDIMLWFFTKTTIFEEYLSVRQDINLKIMDILEEEGVSMAFPSRSIYIETVPDEPKTKNR
ncbi:mechanosensitive ion channel family protein [Thermosyntropha sp.]|uniref:mechanosensitive ion channel family protein n=1 Tax=Thermosyntropha sp. TaxID=2740820 RepID=UPI0025F8D18C|nr:mechanosensitive ion channel family protein [Thermosyntropha sp.]